jgi:hypothetical protein
MPHPEQPTCYTVEQTAWMFDVSTDRTTNPDCLALGCDWDWGTQPCECGRPHTFRICAHCLLLDDPVCDAAEDAAEDDGDESGAVA